MHEHPYRALALMATLSFLAMYLLMFAMVNSFGNIVGNLNQIYMAGLMTAPMILIEILLMRSMFPNTLINMGIICTAIILGIACWFFIRGQVAIGDEQLLSSMIPHHASAVLMCKKAHLTDQAVQSFCNRIIENQETEIVWMWNKLDMLETQ